MFANAMPFRTHVTNRVRLIDHEEGFVLLLHMNKLWQIGEIAVHTINPFDHNQHTAIIRREFPRGVHRALSNRYAGKDVAEHRKESHLE